jgi:glycerol-3-phosphate dehydrogenase
VFGGKITTARALALEALDRLGVAGFKFTATSPLPGGRSRRLQRLAGELAGWCPRLLERLSRAYGTRLDRLCRRRREAGPARPPFRRRPVRARSALSARHRVRAHGGRHLWRRTKLGLQMSAAEQGALTKYIGA